MFRFFFSDFHQLIMSQKLSLTLNIMTSIISPLIAVANDYSARVTGVVNMNNFSTTLLEAGGCARANTMRLNGYLGHCGELTIE